MINLPLPKEFYLSDGLGNYFPNRFIEGVNFNIVRSFKKECVEEFVIREYLNFIKDKKDLVFYKHEDFESRLSTERTSRELLQVLGVYLNVLIGDHLEIWFIWNSINKYHELKRTIAAATTSKD